MNEAQNLTLVTIEQMSELFKLEPYQPYQEENVPPQLLRDEKTGLLYTEFFCNFGTNLLLSHILVEQLFDNYEQVDWSFVSNNYEPHIISRIAGLYTHPLVWMDLPDNIANRYVITGQFAQEVLIGDRFNDDCFGIVIGIDAPEKRAKFFADTLPTFQPNSPSPLDPKPVHRWNLFLGDTTPLILADIDPDNPYHDKMPLTFFDTNIFKENLSVLPESKMYEIICLLRQEWNSIVRQRLFGIQCEEDVEDFRHYLFDILQDFVERYENQQEENDESRKIIQSQIAKDILEIPKPNKYRDTVTYIKERSKFDPDFKQFMKHSTYDQKADLLSKIFGWTLDANALAKRMNYHKK